MTSTVKVDTVQANTAATLTLNDAVDINETLNVDGNTTLIGTLDVTGATTAAAITASGIVTANAGADVNGFEIILDADADTSITADTDDQIDIKISGADDFQFTANTLTALSGSTIATNTIAETTAASGVTIDSLLIKDGAPDLNGVEMIVDADADSSITADTDDRLDIKLGGTDSFYFYPATTGGSSVFRKNAIINGDFSVSQRGTSFTSATTVVNNDDTYLLDRWILLSDGNDTVDVTQDSTTIPTNGLYAIALDVETANKKFGILQVIEQKNCKGYIGNTCTVSFKAKVSATTNLDNVKVAIISWDSTADTVTSDIVNAWGVEGTNPTLVTNWTYENAPANLSVTTSYATYSVSAAIDTASTKNIGIFIWSDVTTTTTGGADILYITDVQLEKGSIATEFEQRTIQDEVMLCQRYYEKTFAYGTAPAQAAGQLSAGVIQGVASGTSVFVTWIFKKTKRAAPTITTYNPTQANANWRNIANDADAAVTVNSTGDNGVSLSVAGVASDTTGYQIHATASAEL